MKNIDVIVGVVVKFPEVFIDEKGDFHGILIDIWKFIFSVDKNYKLTLYDYNRFDNNINIFVSINENYDESTYNDILTNVNNISSIDNDINFFFLKKYNL